VLAAAAAALQREWAARVFFYAANKQKLGPARPRPRARSPWPVFLFRMPNRARVPGARAEGGP
jgi:hypothetical protein